jgi:hypothetical protein
VFKRFFIILFIIASAIAFWFSFAIWTGLYSVYTFPPTKADPDGSTLIVSREEGEPAFNSPQHPVPPKKEVRTGGIGFGSVGRLWSFHTSTGHIRSHWKFPIPNDGCNGTSSSPLSFTVAMVRFSLPMTEQLCP